MMRWLQRMWASMTWEPTWPPPPVASRARIYQPLLDCTMVVDEEAR